VPGPTFKLRGIGYTCQKAISEGATALVSSSGGNAGLATAYAGQRLKVRRCRLKSVFASTEQDALRLGSLTHCPCVLLCYLTTCYCIERAWFQRLKVKCGEPLSNFARISTRAATSRSPPRLLSPRPPPSSSEPGCGATAPM
jgi:hypothetical protein